MKLYIKADLPAYMNRKKDTTFEEVEVIRETDKNYYFVSHTLPNIGIPQHVAKKDLNRFIPGWVIATTKEKCIRIWNNALQQRIDFHQKLINELEDLKMATKEVKKEISGLAVKGHSGTWYEIDRKEYLGNTYILLQSEQWGDEANGLLILDDYTLIKEDCFNSIEEELAEYSDSMESLEV